MVLESKLATPFGHWPRACQDLMRLLRLRLARTLNEQRLSRLFVLFIRDKFSSQSLPTPRYIAVFVAMYLYLKSLPTFSSSNKKSWPIVLSHRAFSCEENINIFSMNLVLSSKIVTCYLQTKKMRYYILFFAA